MANNVDISICERIFGDFALIFYQISAKRVQDDSRGTSSFHTNSSPEAAAAADQSGADSLF